MQPPSQTGKFDVYTPASLITMAPVSMWLHVSYMRSLCKTEWRTGRQMILSAVRHGVAKEFIRFCAGLRVNKRSRISLYPKSLGSAEPSFA